MLIETYIRERDEQNPYDYIYSLDDEGEEINESRQTARRTRASVVSYYVDGAAADGPTDVGNRENQGASGGVDSIESVYVEEVEDTRADRKGDYAAVEIESYYVDEKPMLGN